MDTEEKDFDRVSHCAICRRNGDDYYLDGEDNWVNACIGCCYNDNTDEEDNSDDI
jgi:hypothetical protein